jgi:hypothetical protein
MEFRLFILIAMLLGATAQAAPEFPELINVRGRLVDGTNAVNGNVELVLRLYD